MQRDCPSAQLEASVGRLLSQRRLTVAVAESATGGLVLHRLTNVSGSSAYVLGGIVAYSNDSKERLLGVRRQTLTEHGAVSAETAVEMARGVRNALDADIGVSTTGIAGPMGATASKPVGLVHIAVVAPAQELQMHFVAAGDRLQNKERFAEEALRLLERAIVGTDSLLR